MNQISNGLRIFVTAGMRNVAFPCIVGLMIGIFCHLIDNGTDNFSLCANLISWNQASQVIHVKERADVQYTADRTCCLRDAPAFYVEFQIGGEEPVMYVQPVLFSEAEDFVQGLAFITQIRQLIHQKSISGRCAKRIHDQDPAVRITFFKTFFCNHCGIDNSRESGRKCDMQDILSCFQEGLEIFFEFLGIDL